MNNQDISFNAINGYQRFLSPPSVSGIIRLVVYVRKDVMVKERPDLMRPDICSVWLEVGYKHQKKILLCNVYREWQELGANNTGNITEQLLRWTKILDMWEIALASYKAPIMTKRT